jgi:alkylated DNA nucleotide flippase Atl1
MSLAEDVADLVAAIPAGRVASYGDLAVQLGVGPRQVGRVMPALADGVPWWRVVRADGTPATCHDGRAPALLAEDHTPFRGRRVDMRAARVTDWSGLSDHPTAAARRRSSR